MVKELLITQGTWPAKALDSTRSGKKLFITNTVEIQFGRMDSKASPACSKTKGSPARSISRNSSMTKKKSGYTPNPPSKIGLAAARRQASSEKNQKEKQLEVSSNQYNAKNGPKAFKTMEHSTIKSYKVPPLPKKTLPHLTHLDSNQDIVVTQRGEMSCKVQGSNFKLGGSPKETSSTSPLKGKAQDQGLHKDKQLSSLLTLCKQVDQKHGFSNSLDSNFNNGNLVDEIKEVDGEGDLTANDLEFEVTEVIANNVIARHADRPIHAYLQDERALEVVSLHCKQYKADIKSRLGEKVYTQLFDSIQNQLVHTS